MPTASVGGPPPTEGEIIIAEHYIPWAVSAKPAWSTGTAPPPLDRSDMLNPRIVSPRARPLNAVKGHHILQPSNMLVRNVPPEVAAAMLEHVRRQGGSTDYQNPVSYACTLRELRRAREETELLQDYVRRVPTIAQPEVASPRYLRDRGYLALPHDPAPLPPDHGLHHCVMMRSPRRPRLPDVDFKERYVPPKLEYAEHIFKWRL